VLISEANTGAAGGATQRGSFTEIPKRSGSKSEIRRHGDLRVYINIVPDPMGHISKKHGKKPPDRSMVKPLRLLTWNIRYDWMNTPVLPQKVRIHTQTGH
jgi:hypothetical protein